MINLTSFSPSFNVAIIGATGGIGSALSDILESHDDVGSVYRLSRNQKDHINPCNEASIKKAAAQFSEYLLNVINNVTVQDTGKIYAWDGEDIKP